MYKHNFYIVNKDAELSSLADYIYQENSEQQRKMFVESNKVLCSKGRVKVGQTLYLPQQNTQDLNAIQIALLNIDATTQKLTPRARNIKAFNHQQLVLGVMSDSMGMISAGIRYRLGRFQTILENYDGELGDFFRTGYRPGGSIQEAIDIAFDYKNQLEVEADTFARLTFSHDAQFVTGIVERLRLRHDLAKVGIVDPKLTTGDWALENWEKYFTRFNKVSEITNKIGHVGVLLDGLAKLDNIGMAYKQYGLSNKFGESAFGNAGAFGGDLYGSVIGAQLGKKMLASGLGDGVVEIVMGVAEVVGDGLTAAAVVVAGSEVVAAIAEMVFIGVVGWLTMKIFSEIFSYTGHLLYDVGTDLIVLFEKGYHKWI